MNHNELYEYNLSNCPTVYNTVPSETGCEACSLLIRTQLLKHP